MFGYQIRNIEEQVKECGFPEVAINKVKAKLEDKKINYAIFDRRNNYEEEETCNFKNLNTYDILEIAYEANILENIELKKQLICKMIAKIKIVDFLLSVSYDKKLITQKKYVKLGQRLDDIAKYANGWMKTLKST